MRRSYMGLLTMVCLLSCVSGQNSVCASWVGAPLVPAVVAGSVLGADPPVGEEEGFVEEVGVGEV